MPFFILFTSLSSSKIPCDFLKKTSQVVASALSKPNENMCVHVLADQMVFFGAEATDSSSSEKAYAILKSVGKVSLEENRKTISIVTDHINKELGIRKDRIKMIFEDLKSEDVGTGDLLLYDKLKKT